MIPPKAQITVYGVAPPVCTARLSEPMNVFGVFQHAHLAATALETRLYRNGVEQQPLVLNPTYDFNFQALHSLHPVRQVNPQDTITISCTYTTTDEHVAFLRSLGAGCAVTLCCDRVL